MNIVHIITAATLVLLTGCTKTVYVTEIEYVDRWHKCETANTYLGAGTDSDVKTTTQRGNRELGNGGSNDGDSTASQIKSEPMAAKKKSKPKLLVNPKSNPKTFKTPPPNVKIKAPTRYQDPNNNEPMRFMLGRRTDGTEYVDMFGTFTDHTYIDFRKFIKKINFRGREIAIRSNGGSLAPAMEIGRYVKNNHWNTVVNKKDQCHSACTFVFVAGQEKIIEPGTILGFHRPYTPGIPDTPKNVAEIKREYVAYWEYVDGNPELYEQMMNTCRNNLFILNQYSIHEYMNEVHIREAK